MNREAGRVSGGFSALEANGKETSQKGMNNHKD